MIKLIRADERLIHGQCMQFIVNDYQIKEIIVVDDETAANKMLKSIFEMAVPKNLKASVYTVNEAIPKVSAANTNAVNTLILMKNPRTLIPLLKAVSDLPKILNIGPQMARGGIKCVDFATLHPKDIEACKELTKNGVRVYFNSIGANGTSTEWKALETRV